MSDPAQIAAALVDMTPRERAVWLLERAQVAVEEARPGSVAYVQSLRAVARASQELEELRAADQVAYDAANLTAAEWRDKVEQDAQQATDDDLEIYVTTWLARNGYALSVSNGALLLERVG